MKKLVLAIVVALLVAGGFAWFLYTQYTPTEKSQNTESQIDSTAVENTANPDLSATMPIEEGIHFQNFLPNESKENSGSEQTTEAKLVQEFFSYTCMHCRKFAPVLEQWKAQHNNARVEYVPVIWNEETELYAQVFYALHERPDFAKLHSGFFDFVATLPRTQTTDERKASIVRFFVDQGVSAIELLDAMESESNADKVAQAVLLARQYEVSSTPTLVVAQRYKVLNSSLTELYQLLHVVNTLLAKKS